MLVQKAAKIIAENLSNLDSISTATAETLSAIPTIGTVLAESLTKYFALDGTKTSSGIKSCGH
jgi:DNA ligase (NAD+)